MYNNSKIKPILESSAATNALYLLPIITRFNNNTTLEEKKNVAKRLREPINKDIDNFTNALRARYFYNNTL